MEKLRTSTYLVLTGLLLLLSKAAGRTTYGNSSQDAITSKERIFEQNTTKNTTLGRNIPSDVGRRFVRNTALGCTEEVEHNKKYRGDNLFLYDKNGVEIHGSHTKPADSFEACRDICRSTLGCNYWSFVPSWNVKCLLKKNVRDKIFETGRISGSVCQECVKEENTFLRDERPIEWVHSQGENDCAKLCGESPECKFWHLQKSDNVCKLTKFSSRHRADGFITGTKICGIDPPQVTVDPPSQTAQPGDNLQIICTATGDAPIQIVWTKERGYFSQSATQYNQGNGNHRTLQFRTISSNDAGRYICKATNAAGMAESGADVIVNDRPQVTVDPPSQTVQPGDNPQIICTATGDTPIQIVWTKERGYLPQSATQYNQGNGNHRTLQFSSISPNDAGRYICKATNAVGVAESGADVIVNDPPQVTVDPPSQMVQPGDNPQIICTATGDTPIQIVWTKERGYLPQSATQYNPGNGNHRTLQFSSISPNDAGRYICKATNAVGVAESGADVIVNDPPPYVLYDNGPGCGASSIQSSFECSKAARALGFKETVIVGDWLNSPPGCMVKNINGNWKSGTYFNNFATGETGNSVYRSVCHKGLPSCDINTCLDTEKCQDDHCEDACTGISCTGGEVCLAKDHASKCVTCISNGECQDDEECYSNNCISSCPLNACTDNPTERYCIPQNHNYECVECTAHQHCDHNKKCSASNQCVECTQDDHCDDDERCSEWSNRCYSVCSSANCNNYHCIPNNHRAVCVQCTTDQHCENDKKCQGKKCISVCTADSCKNFGFNKQCKPLVHSYTCVKCTQDSHCDQDKKCSANNICNPVCSANKCQSNANEKHCKAINHEAQCVRCTEDSHCDQDETCSANNQCIRCTQNEDCNDDEKCQSNDCKPVCTSTTCMSGNKRICIPHKHNPFCLQCAKDHQCSPSEKCQRGKCVDVCESNPCRSQAKNRCKATNHIAECVYCTRDIDCDQDKKCDPESNECVDVCSDTQCSAANTKCVPENHEPKCFCKEGYETLENTCKLITKWTNWVDEGVCSEECGGGSQLQTRQCLDYQDNPLDEAKCPGQGSQYLTCNTQYCGVTANSPSGDPSKIVDGDNSTFFISAKEDYPWLQLEYTITREISGIRIELGELQENIALRNLEVRIGEINISKTMDPQAMNTLCKFSENMSIPVHQVTQIDIACDKRLSGKFITVQKKLNDTQLHIFKIELLISCPESHPLASNNRKNCCPNSTDTKEECQDIKGCPDNLCIATNYIQFAANTEENVSGLLFGIIGVLLLIFTVTVFVLLLLKRKGSRTPKATQTNKNHAVTIVEIQPLTADHIIIKKPTNKKVKDKEFLKALKNTAKDSGALKREFRALEQLVAETIEVNKATTVGKLEENKTRNRYRDMVPYDHNIVYLEKPMGQPPSKYINASWITFPDDNQRYLAVQAPKVNMFSSFWQLVWEKKVGTIVMITDLEEGGKVKAHQYWPDKDNIVMDIGNGITLHYIKHEFPGTYYSRLIEVKYNNQKRMVNQIQTTAWLDLTAPKDSKILLDLVYKAQELLDENPGPVLVHCSAGVGRTGTFVGLYHLIKDYENDAVKEIDFYKTVLRMREQRMKMVQKHPQYHYIAKCLADYVSAQESEYG